MREQTADSLPAAGMRSMLVHDIKASLAIIGGLVNRLTKHRVGTSEAKQKQYLEIIRKEGAKLQNMLQDFLACVHRSAPPLRLGILSLTEELTDLVDAYQVKAVQCGIDLELQLPAQLSAVSADGQRLHRVFANLLENALKFSPPESRIMISARETSREVIVTIEDQGSGIAPQDLPRIFEPYYRGQGERLAKGSGLGLTTVKAMVEAHGGMVKVESQPGRGSAFSVLLPKPAPKKIPHDEKVLNPGFLPDEMCGGQHLMK